MKHLLFYKKIFLLLLILVPISVFAQCPLMPGSVLIDGDDEVKMSEWFGNNRPIGGQLLYRMSVNGASSSTFHSLCDGKGPTLVLIRNSYTNQVFGGYNPQSWHSGGSYQNGTGGFLFNLTFNYKLNQTNNYYQTYNSYNYGPTFGGGHDIYVQNQMNYGGYNYAYSYESSSSKGYYYLSGTYNFAANEIEVYALNPAGITANGPTTVCAGESVTLNAFGGDSYLWSTGAVSSSITVNQTGNYSVTITNSNSQCPSVTYNQSVTVNSPLNLTATQVNATASGACNGSVTLNPSGGTPPYSQGSGIDFSGTTINSNALSYGGVGAQFIQNNELKFNSTSYNWYNYLYTNQTVSRTAGKTFQGKFKADYGTYTMIGWHNSSTNADYTNMTHAIYVAGGSYIYIYERGQYMGGFGGYQTSVWYDFKIELLTVGAKYYIKPVTSSTWTLITTTNTVSDTDLRAGLSFYGYAYPYPNSFFYTDDWSVGGSNPPLTGLCAGVYNYSVTDALGCIANTQVTITNSNPVNFSASSIDAICTGSSTGSITLNATGGAGNYQYSINGGQTYSSGNVFNGLAAGTYTLVVKDSDGSISTQTQAVTITEPSLLTSVSSSGVIACNGGTTSVSVAAFGGTSPYTGTGNFIVPAGTHSYIITDANGCTSNTSVEVTDPAALVASSYAGTIPCDDGSTTVTVSANGGTTPYSGIGDFIVTAGNYSYTVTDANGCTQTTSVSATVLDNIAPIALTQNITVSLDAAGNASITASQVDNGSSDACGIASLIVSPNSFTCANVGDNLVTLTVTDVHGNVTTKTAIVRVQDSDAPVALTQSITVSLDAAGNASITATQVDNGSSDACGIASLSVSPNTFTCGNVGNNTVTLTVTDIHGNVSTETTTVTVQDNVAPVALTRNITVSLDATGNASITATQIDNGSSDACGIALLSVSPNNFTCANVGNNTVTLTVSDNNGNVSNETATVTVQDNVAPVALTQNITVQLDATGNTSITAADVNNGSIDACGIATLSVTPNTFDCANVGNNTVTLTVTDNNGNVSTATATVTVEDNVAPVALTQNITVQLDATGNTSITTADVNNGSTDACGIATLSVSPNTFDCSNVGTNTVTLTATDVNGNVSTQSATVAVEDNIVPVISCPANIAIQAQSNDCSPIVTWNAPSITDNCTFTVSSNHQPGDHFPVGTTTVNYSVSDASGNIASCSFVVTVTPDPLVASVLAKTYVGGYNISCNGKNDGEVTATVNGGCLPYTYSWSTTPTQTGAVATGLTSGTYTVIITDANGSVTNVVTTLTEPTQLVVEAGSNQTVYFGYAPKACASLNGTATGGVAAYTYSWSNGASATATNVCPSVTTTYDFTVTDLNGCVASDLVTVCAIDVRCEKGGNAILKGQGNKVMICHRSGNGKTQTLCIDASAIADHLAHGDQLGECGVNLTCFTPAGREMEESDNATIENIGNSMNVLAYPNPFNTTTTISFNSTQDDRVSIKVYNIEGAEVSNLFEGNLKAGDVKDVIFDGTSLPNGIYFYKVMTNGGKMIVNKLIISK